MSKNDLLRVCILNLLPKCPLGYTASIMSMLVCTFIDFRWFMRLYPPLAKEP